MMRRAESATAVSSVWLAKKTTAVSMMANINARNGAATMPNSTAAMPSSPRAKRRTVLKRSRFMRERAALFRPQGRPGLLGS